MSVVQPASDRPRASIIIANYNYARFLRRCIDSALEQDHPGVEVVVVDDDSSDGSAAVIRSYGSRIVPCLKAANGGHAAAFNEGFAASRGDIVFFLDADDFLYPQAVSTVVRSEEHTSELQSLMRISYAVFCLKKK